MIRDAYGTWLDSYDVTVPTEAPVTLRTTETRITMSIHWSQWLVPGNPLSERFQQAIDSFVAAGWSVTRHSDHWTPEMLEHYRE